MLYNPPIGHSRYCVLIEADAKFSMFHFRKKEWGLTILVTNGWSEAMYTEESSINELQKEFWRLW